MNNNNKPIAMFDSGVGGLSVLEAVTQLLPNEKFIY
ncbi:MAG: glutamate racemase, partial [Chloroflexi bacterium]|nr:glutamate racemase [Chloroflexota bacterium]